MANPATFYFDFDGCFIDRINEWQHLANLQLLNIVKNRRAEGADVSLRGLTSYSVFQARPNRKDPNGTVRSGNSRSRFIVEAQRYGVPFDALLVTSSPYFDGENFGSFGKKVLEFERKEADAAREENKTNPALDPSNFDHNLQYDGEPFDVDKFSNKEDATSDIVMAFVTFIKSVGDSQEAINEFFSQPADGVVGFFEREVKKTFEGDSESYLQKCEPYLREPKIIQIIKKNLIDFTNIIWPENISDELKGIYFNNKGPMLLHALRQHKRPGEEVVLFDDKLEVVRMLDILRRQPEFSHLKVKGIQVNTKTATNQDFYYEQQLERDESFVSYVQPCVSTTAEIKRDIEGVAIPESPFVFQREEVESFVVGTRDITVTSNTGEQVTYASLQIPFAMVAYKDCLELTGEFKQDQVQLSKQLSLLADSYRRIILQVRYQDQASILIYDGFARQWSIVQSCAYVHRFCEKSLRTKYAGVKELSDRLVLTEPATAVNFAQAAAELHTDTNNKKLDVLFRPTLTWRDHFIAARKLALDENNITDSAKMHIVKQILTGFIVLRIIKTILRVLIEMPVRALELKLEDMVRQRGYDLARSPIIKLGLWLLSTPRLFLRAVISPMLSYEHAKKIEDPRWRLVARYVSVAVTAVVWALLSVFAFPVAISALSGGSAAVLEMAFPSMLGVISPLAVFGFVATAAVSLWDYMSSKITSWAAGKSSKHNLQQVTFTAPLEASEASNAVKTLRADQRRGSSIKCDTATLEKELEAYRPTVVYVSRAAFEQQPRPRTQSLPSIFDVAQHDEVITPEALRGGTSQVYF